jgi:hypothetical protein
MSGNNGSSLLFRILVIFRQKSNLPLNYREICDLLDDPRKVVTLRSEIKGALHILTDIGLIRCVRDKPTNKEFMLSDPMPFSSLGEKIKKIYESVPVGETR